MSETMMMAARTAADEMKTRVVLWMLGRENARLNELLQENADRRDRAEREAEALKRELAQLKKENEKVRQANRRYRAERAAAYQQVLGEAAGTRTPKREKALEILVIGLVGAVIAFAVITAIIWAV